MLEGGGGHLPDFFGRREIVTTFSEGIERACPDFIDFHRKHHRSTRLWQLAAHHVPGRKSVIESLLDHALSAEANECSFHALSALKACNPSFASEIAAPAVNLLTTKAFSPRFTLDKVYGLITGIGGEAVSELNILLNHKVGFIKERALKAAKSLIRTKKALHGDFPGLEERDLV